MLIPRMSFMFCCFCLRAFVPCQTDLSGFGLTQFKKRRYPNFIRTIMLPAALSTSSGYTPELLRELSLLAAKHGGSNALGVKSESTPRFTTGLSALDAIAPPGGLACGAVHELLSEPSCRPPLTVAAFLARCAAQQRPDGAIVWCDARGGGVYPPALAAMGIPLDRLLLIRAKTFADEIWATSECAACLGVAATIAGFHHDRLSRVQVRRLQLAVERGGGVGLLMRPVHEFGRAEKSAYAAATRWLVRPVAGDALVRRWELRLLHGHGGRINEGVILEVCRETNIVRASEAVADRPAAPKDKRRSA